MTKTRFSIAAAALLAFSGLAQAADFPEGDAKPFQFELNYVWDSFDTTARLDVSRQNIVSVGTTIDFEQLLDVPVMDSHFRGTGQWRVSRVSYVQVSYENVRRTGKRIVDREIVWGDETFGAGAEITGTFNTDEVYLGYRWDAFKADNVRLGLTIGCSYYDIAAGLAGEGELTKPDGTVQNGSFDRGFDVKAPVPVIGLAGEGAISSQFLFSFYVHALSLRTGDFSGGTLAGGLAVKWYATPNFGLVGGVDASSIRIRKYVDGNNTYSASYGYSGPRLGLVVAF